MKNINIDLLYSKLEKHLLLIEAYTEIKFIAELIKACRLKPKNYDINKLSLQREWHDEFGNSLLIDKNKKIKIILNDFHIDRSDVSTDIYYGHTIYNSMKISKSLLLQKNNNYIFMALYGMDNFLRSFLYNERCIRVSPLMLGHNSLLWFLKNKSLNSYLKEDNCMENYIMRLPFNKKLIDNYQEDIANIIKENIWKEND